MSACTVCQKDSMEHSKKLWEMHRRTIEAAKSKTRHKKLWTMQIGFGPKCPALLDKGFSYDSKLNMAEWLTPVYMPCTECGLYLGSIEVDHADILGGMCLECFRKMTDQPGGYGE